MFDSTNILVNKLILRIRRSKHIEPQETVFDTVKHILHQQLNESFHLPIEWEAFNRGGKFRSPDDQVNAQIASLTSEVRTLWATKISARDTETSRRQWIVHIGLRVFSTDDLSLCYAKCCYDHTAGSIQNPRALPLTLDRLLDPIFFSEEVQCMCGDSPLIVEPVELTSETFHDFVEILMDKQRPCPVLLISCVDALVPEEAADILLGNAIVYWCTDASIMMRLNAMLPEELYTPWDCVRAFLPMSVNKPYHPIWTYEEIRRMGEDEFLKGLRQAYCASMRSQERRDFLTVEDVCRYRDQMRIYELEEQLEKQKKESSRLLSQSERQNSDIVRLRDQLQSLKQSADAKTLNEYESLLSETMAEADALKRGISALSERLYSTLGTGFTPEETEPVASIQELSHAIYVALTNAGSRKG